MLLVAATFVATRVTIPYYAISPGPAREVIPLIHVTGHPVYGSDGKLIMTTVAYRPLTPVRALVAWIDPNQTIVPREQLVSPGETATQEHQRSLSEMDSSKIDAATVVLRTLGLDSPTSTGGGLIESVVPSCPAEGKLFAGDLIHSVDGKPVSDAKEVSEVIDAVPNDRPITFTISAAGETHDVTLTRMVCAGSNRPLIGISTVDDFPFGISIASGDVGGPSAGMMYALALYDVLTPGDLTGGRTIAGTGTIDLDGKIGAIGEVGEKVVAAERAGADLFLVDSADYPTAKAASDGSMTIHSVSTFKDALAYLGAPSGTSGLG
jgi:Lon-like protease